MRPGDAMSDQPSDDNGPSDDAHSPVKAAATVGAAGTLILVALSFGSDQAVGEGIAAALSNGLVLFFLMAGFGYLKAADCSWHR